MSRLDPDRHMQTLRRFGLDKEDLAAWHASGVADDRFEDWLVDRLARRPSGSRARRVYGAEDVHDFARRAILDALKLGAVDHLLDIGCGGGLLLRDALASGAAATGVDHSEDMVVLARERAPSARVLLASAEQLPFAEATFSAVSMSVVFFFLDDPRAALGEGRRVLVPDGQLVLYTTALELRGTPAVPEPIASKGYFYSDVELVGLACEAGLRAATVHNDRGGQLLVARR